VAGLPQWRVEGEGGELRGDGGAQPIPCVAVLLVVAGDGGVGAFDGRVEREERVDGLLRRLLGRGGRQLREGAVKKSIAVSSEYICQKKWRSG
jgi:hypothetical protein